jgi:hypothetical protein
MPTALTLNRPLAENGTTYTEALEEGTTKVMILYRGAGSDDFVCDLRKVRFAELPLDEVRSYDALSYMWGAQGDPAFLCLCGHRFAITQNLTMAIRDLRPLDSNRML